MARLFAARLSVRLIVLVLLAPLPRVGLTVYTASAEWRHEAAHVKAQALAAGATLRDQEIISKEPEQLGQGLRRENSARLPHARVKDIALDHVPGLVIPDLN